MLKTLWQKEQFLLLIQIVFKRCLLQRGVRKRLNDLWERVKWLYCQRLKIHLSKKDMIVRYINYKDFSCAKKNTNPSLQHYYNLHITRLANFISSDALWGYIFKSYGINPFPHTTNLQQTRAKIWKMSVNESIHVQLFN